MVEGTGTPRKFREVPADTRQLTIVTLLESETEQLVELGKRLKYLRRLVLRYGRIVNLDFLKSYTSIHSLAVCGLSDLRDYSAISNCAALQELLIDASLSSVGRLSFLCDLPDLEALRLEGPNPSKGMEQVQAMRKLKRLSLYAPRWNLERLPEMFPNLESLAISQGGYKSLRFLERLDKLTEVEIHYARHLTEFMNVNSLLQLRQIELGHALTGLRSCSQLGLSRSVETIKFNACKKLKDIRSLIEWPSLKRLTLYDCPLVPPSHIQMLKNAGKQIIGVRP